MANFNQRNALFQKASADLYQYKYRSIQKYRNTFAEAIFTTINTATAIAAGLGTEAAVEAAKKFLGSIDFASRNNKLLLGNAWARAGATAQVAMLEAYDETEIRGGHGSYTIPRGNRLSGHLRPALASPEFFQASSEGIAWGNLAILNAQALHWARMNFGAGARGEAQAGAIAKGQSRYQRFALVQGNLGGQISAFSEQVLQSGIGHFGPRPAFTMPAGQWVMDSGQLVGPHQVNPSVDQFIPGKHKGPHTASDFKPLFMKDRPTLGIAPRRFMDVGVRVLVLSFGDQLVGVIKQWEKLETGPIHQALQQGFLRVDAEGVWHQGT